ncbi:hypothetical protein AVEN_231200-1 [Araneus ventricosus]|uniref:Uncharacterized protein n=1 Tax=Araneus ventricosus TaxID=182803 RepID=A0A4Y2GVE1_ARAVE|nr:hypothetical protein AVEN_231200-1 [Araneus ventricosus]
MTSTTTELTPPLQTSAPHQRKEIWPLCMILRATGPLHGSSPVELVFEPGTLRPKGRDITTRPPRPLNNMENEIQSLKLEANRNGFNNVEYICPI